MLNIMKYDSYDLQHKMLIAIEKKQKIKGIGGAPNSANSAKVRPTKTAGTKLKIYRRKAGSA
jgi:hypothetical protein